MQTSTISDTRDGEISHGIQVSAASVFAPEESDPTEPRFVFRYTIVISNEGDSPARLISRHWVIIDGNGHREEVQGPGVIGKTPRLEPGKKFEYQSYCLLKTAWGTMEGIYQMKRDDGSDFDAEIPRFFLKSN